MGSIFEKNGCSDRLVIQTKFSRGSPDTRSARLQRRKLGNPRKETEEVSVSFDEALSAVRGFPLKISPGIWAGERLLQGFGEHACLLGLEKLG